MLTFVKNEPALVLRQSERILVIPDLHLGFEREFCEKGIIIPSQTNRILSKIRIMIRRHKVDRLIFLGDVKHGTSKILLHEWKEIPEFFESLLLLVKRVEIIPGNHDGGLIRLLPEKVIIHSVKGILLKHGSKTVTLIHGHAWPMIQALGSDTLIMAHHHFVADLRESSGLKIIEPIWVVGSWSKSGIAKSFLRAQGFYVKEDPSLQFRRNFDFDISQPKIIIMPAFNHLLGGMVINSSISERNIGPLFRSDVIDKSSLEIYLLDGTFLGKLPSLRSLQNE